MDDTQTTAVVETSSTPVADTSATSVSEASTATPSPRPSSMREALEQAAARHAAPDGEAAPDAAAAEPVPGETQPASKRGPVPLDVHETSLKNAREKAVEEYRQRHGWAEQVDPQEFQQVQQIARHFKPGADPVEGLRNLIAEIRKDPQADAAIRSMHARELAALRGQTTQGAQAEQEPQPDLPIQLEDGRVVHLYSAEQQAKREAFLQAKWLQSVEQKLQPLQQSHEQSQKREAALQLEAEVDHYANTTYADLQTWPGMQDKAARVAVANEMQAMRLSNDASPEQVSLALNAAYRKVVLPTLSAKGAAQQLASLKQKAVAQVESPSRSAATSSTRPRTPAELAKFMQQRAAERRG